MARRRKKGRGFHGKAVSRVQAGLFGLRAAGKRTRGGKAMTLSPRKAREKLRGVKVKRLPFRKKKRRR